MAKRSFWLVSPNVNNQNSDVPEWKRASIRGRVALMGYEPGRHPIANRFVGAIAPGDVILIARRHHWAPEIVGFGVVKGPARRTLQGVKTPAKVGAIRKLSPFIVINKAPGNLKIVEILHHTSSLTRLRPETDRRHFRVCQWMERLLPRKRSGSSYKEIPTKIGRQISHDLRLVDSPKHHQLDYIVRSKRQVISAKKEEAVLLIDYQRWLKKRGRCLVTTKHGQLQCDAFELKRRNLIEAKSSIRREHIRMAIGQLFDYSCQIEKKFGGTHKAILLPEKPRQASVSWLRRWKISLIWREKAAFQDNANGKFV
jgi:hypothetical protein